MLRVLPLLRYNYCLNSGGIFDIWNITILLSVIIFITMASNLIIFAKMIKLILTNDQISDIIE